MPLLPNVLEPSSTCKFLCYKAVKKKEIINLKVSMVINNKDDARWDSCKVFNAEAIEM